MVRRTFCFVAIGTSLCVFPNAQAGAKEAELAIPQALFNYVQREEKVFAWKLNGRQELEQGTIYDLDLTSQEWHGIVWKHALVVCEPKQLRYPNHVMLFVTGGSNGNRPGRPTGRTP